MRHLTQSFVLLAGILATSIAPVPALAGESALRIDDPYVRLVPPGTATTGAVLPILNARRAGRRLGVRCALRGLGFLVVAEVAKQVGLAHTTAGAVGGFLDHDIGLDALGLDRAPVRRVVARGGQLDRRVVV